MKNQVGEKLLEYPSEVAQRGNVAFRDIFSIRDIRCQDSVVLSEDPNDLPSQEAGRSGHQNPPGRKQGNPASALSYGGVVHCPIDPMPFSETTRLKLVSSGRVLRFATIPTLQQSLFGWRVNPADPSVSVAFRME